MTVMLKAKDSDFEYQFEIFYDLVIKTRTDLRLFSIEISRLEKELNNILDRYYKFANNLSNNENIDNSLVGEEKILLTIEAIFRKLNKLFDLEINFNITDISLHIEQLFKIEQSFATNIIELDQTPRENLEHYADKCDEIIAKLKVMKNAHDQPELLDSTIQRQFFWEKMCADELVEKIKSDIAKELL